MIPFVFHEVDSEADKSKLTQIFETYYGLMMHVAYGILKDRASAEDVVQDSFLKLLRYLDKIEKIPCHKTKGFVVVLGSIP